MKRKSQLLNSTLLAALIIIMAALTGCNKTEDTLTSLIPVDRPCMIAAVDLDRLAGDFGVTITDGRFTFPAELAWVDSVVAADKQAKAIEVLKTIDRSMMMVFTETGTTAGADNTFILVKLTDPDGFKKALADQGASASSSVDGYELMTISGSNAIMRGDLCWLTKLTPAQLNDVAARCKKVNLDRVEGVKQALDAEGFLRFAIMTDPGTDPDGQTGSWQTSTLRLDGPTLALNSKSMLGDGKAPENEFVSTLSTDFLRYVPDGMTLVGAVGRNDKPATAEQISKVLKSTIPVEAGVYSAQIGQIIDMLAPYIASINGTSALAINAFNPPYGAMLMVHMPQQTVNESITKLGQLAASAGLTTTTDPKTGAITADLRGLGEGWPESVTVSNTDGYLLITTFGNDGRYNNSYATTFTNKDVGFEMAVPTTLLLPQAPFAYTFEMRGNGVGAEGKALMTFAGSDKSFAMTVAQILKYMAYTR